MSLISRHASLLVLSLVPAALAACVGADAVGDGDAQNEDAALAGSCVGTPVWAENKPYKVGDKVQYKGKAYTCTQAHTSLSTWTPDVVPALWQDTGTCSSTSGVTTAASTSSGSTTSSGAGGAGGAGGSSSSSTTTGSGAGGGTGGSGLGAILSKATFEQMFPNKNALFSYEAFISAANAFPAFASQGTVEVRKRELAAFLANISHETTGGWPTAPGGAQAWGLYFTQEVGCENGACPGYCVADAKYPCAPGKTYHGRGPIQLSYNFNYGPAGEALKVDLLHNPDLVTSDGTIAFKTGLWFWMTPQAPKPSSHDVMTGTWKPSAADTTAGRKPGFGMTVNIINGGIECQKATPPQVTDRVAFYQRYTGMLSVDMGQAVYCDQMAHY